MQPSCVGGRLRWAAMGAGMRAARLHGQCGGRQAQDYDAELKDSWMETSFNYHAWLQRHLGRAAHCRVGHHDIAKRRCAGGGPVFDHSARRDAPGPVQVTHTRTQRHEPCSLSFRPSSGRISTTRRRTRCGRRPKDRRKRASGAGCSDTPGLDKPTVHVGHRRGAIKRTSAAPSSRLPAGRGRGVGGPGGPSLPGPFLGAARSAVGVMAGSPTTVTRGGPRRRCQHRRSGA